MKTQAKFARIAALWLALLALAVLYTDRDAYTWAFEGADAAQVIVSPEQADAAQKAADAHMLREKQEANARKEQGLWGKDEPYGADFQPFRPAVDAETGLNLMWGDYEAAITYGGEGASASVVSAGRQSFIKGGEAQLTPGENVLAFTLTNGAEQVRIACSDPEGVAAVTVRKAGQRVISPDLAALAVLAGIVLTWLLTLSGKTGADAQESRRDALVLVGAALFASMPLLWGGVYDGHDIFFHLNRIEGIAAGLRCGQFPVRIHASTLLGYGYAAPQFYPELFLYIPALLRCLGVSLAGSVVVFEMAINMATALVCYASARRVLGRRDLALGASVLYTLCIYRIVNLYTRATLGESLAMIFFPLLIWAMLEVLTRDLRKWPLLALAMTGIFMSHLLSTLFASAFCALAALICVRRLIREPKRILAIVKAALLTALCSVWFLVPMLAYIADGISTSVVIRANEHVLTLASYMIGFSGETGLTAPAVEDYAYSIGVVPGIAMLAGAALLAVRRYAKGRDSASRVSMALLGMGVLALLGATDVFPWAWACSLSRPFSTLFMQMQFPWRLVSVAAPMLAMAAACGYLADEKHRSAGFAAIGVLTLVFGGYALQAIVMKTPALDAEGFCDTRIGQYEYTYMGTEKSALVPGEITAATDGEYAVTDFEKDGTSLSFTISMADGCQYIDVPLLYYPGYRATIDGEARNVTRGDTNLLRVMGSPNGQSAQVRVWFEPPVTWLIAQGASLAGAALLGWLLLRRRRA